MGAEEGGRFLCRVRKYLESREKSSLGKEKRNLEILIKKAGSKVVYKFEVTCDVVIFLRVKYVIPVMGF